MANCKEKLTLQGFHGQQILQAFHGQQMKKKFTFALQMKS